MRCLAAAALISLVALSDASAEHHNKTWAQGVKAFEELDYQKAIDLLSRALGEELTSDEKRAAYQKLAVCHIAFEDEAAAGGDFENLLRIDPAFRLDNTVAPRMRAVFDKARAAVDASNPMAEPPTVVMPPPPPKIEPPKLSELETSLEPSHAMAGEAISFHVNARSAGEQAASAQLYYRARGQSAYSKVLGDGHLGHFDLTVPGLGVAAPGIDYYVVATDVAGTTIAVAGTADQPLSIDVGERSHSNKKAIALGVAGGVVVLAVAVGLLVALMPHDAAAGTPGTIMVITH